MQWRSALVWRLLAPAVVVLTLAGCQDELGTGPRIATIKVATGNGQTGAIGALLAQPLVVEVLDQRGDPIEGGVVTWEVTSGGGIVSPHSDTTDASGLAQTTFRLGSNIGVQTVSATLPGVSPVSFIANAVSAPATHLTLVSGDGQAGSVGERLPLALQVRVTDAFDNPKADVPVTYTVISGGGTVSSVTVVSDANGTAQTAWTLGTVAGNQSVIAGSGTIPPVTFTATASPDNPAGIVVVSGGDQIANPGATLADSVVVRVVDRFGNGVPGISVDFVVATASGSVSPTGTTSDASGRAATRWRLGTVGGPNLLTVKAGTLSLPVSAAAFIVFETVNAGGISSCGIDEGGVLYCWGSNNDGALGIGTGPAGSGPIFAFPQAVSLATTQTLAQVNGGEFHNCAVTHSHVGYCWGNNNTGQLGIGTDVRMEPTPSLVGGLPFASIAAGRVHSCGLTIGGRVNCWGSNERGQLGGNVDVDTVAMTVLLLPSNKPVEVGRQTDGNFFGVYDFQAVTTGGEHTCALTYAGAANCWGLGREGQLGNGTNSVQEYMPQVVAGAHAFTKIDGGYNHTCALDGGGIAWCWGNNAHGQLGTGTTASSNVPVAVSGGLSFVAISAGYSHTCALTAGGAVYCWGDNSRGQLGLGTTAPSLSPALVVDGFAFKTVSTGDYATCGVTTSKVALCWGDNEYGNLGDGTLVMRTRPTKVRFQQ